MGAFYSGPGLKIYRFGFVEEAADFDKAFDDGADIGELVDWASAKRPNVAIQRVNVDSPSWVVEGLDRQAQLLGVTRQSLIKLWIAERLH